MDRRRHEERLENHFSAGEVIIPAKELRCRRPHRRRTRRRLKTGAHRSPRRHAGVRGREAPAPAATGSPSAAATAPAPSSAAPDKLDARYFNPNPIHVSRAETATRDGKLFMAMELRDQGYPGNFYALVSDPGSDSLSGVYNHLGLNQQFEVAFPPAP